MADYIHFSNYTSLNEAITAFGQLARREGLNVGVQETMDALQAADAGLLQNMDHLHFALKSIYCCEEEDLVIFDELFTWFWTKEKGSVKSKTTYKNQSNIQKKSNASLVMLGEGKAEEGKEETKNVSGANEIERLRKTDFSKLSEQDSQLLERLAQKLWEQMSYRLKRKMKTTLRDGTIDLRKTIRSSIASGGDPIVLKRKSKKPRKQRLIILLDVSGSMDKYSFFLLRFLCALRTHFKEIEAFIFSTKLIRITDYLQSKNLDLTLSLLSVKANNWSGGTKIGSCLQSFNDQYAKRILNGQTTVVLLSDGLDTGTPELLGTELKKIKLRTRRLIWLNPLKGMQGYEPIQRGMSAALPQIDIFKSAHHLDSLLELEKILVNV